MASIRCENCGAPKKREDKGECPYCGSRYSYKEEDYSAQNTFEEEHSHTYSRTYEQTAAASYTLPKK